MQLTFLGTSAANAFPEAFCRCDHCQAARAEGGRSLRKRSSALVNDDLLIDLGPDIMAASQIHDIDLTGVRYCLQTHPHADHLDPSHLLSRSPDYGVVGAPRLHIYASQATVQKANETFTRDLSGMDLLDPAFEADLNLKAHTIDPLQPTDVGPYRVIGFPANHANDYGALLYAIQDADGAIFYGTDTAVLLEETWQAFHRFNVQFDLVVLDHTYGPDEPASDHLNARELARHVQRMRNEGLLTDRGRAFATHIAHEGNPPHEVLAAFGAQHGYEVAYDGLIVETNMR
jgi:phosphoribosyl 1,2-cyclic phosphodiesterase